MQVPRVVTIMGTGDGYFGMERSVLVAGRARMSCTDRTVGRATIGPIQEPRNDNFFLTAPTWGASHLLKPGS